MSRKGVPWSNRVVKLVGRVGGFGRGEGGEETRDEKHLAVGQLVAVRSWKSENDLEVLKGGKNYDVELLWEPERIP